MPFVDLKFPPGLERNNTPFDTTDRWWDMSGVRFQSGAMLPTGGWNRTTSTVLDTPVRAIAVWRDNTAARFVNLFSDEKVYADLSGTYTDLTPADWVGPGAVQPTGGYGTGPFGGGTFGTPRTTPSPIFSPYGYASFGNWGEDLIYTANTDGRLFYYDVTTPTTVAYRIGPSYSAVDAANFTASIAATVMTVTAIAAGTLAVGQNVVGTGLALDDAGTMRILAQLSGVAGSTGTYTISKSQTFGSLAGLKAHAPTTTGAPLSNKSVLVTAERHVMAIGYNGDPRAIGWSSREAPSDWDVASTTNTSGTLTLTTKTPLLMGFNVAEGVLVMSYSDVFLIRYTAQPYIYGGTDPIADTALFNPRTVATFGGQAAWFGRRGFQLYSGGYVQPLACPFFHDVINGQDDRYSMDPVWGPFLAHGSHNARFPEITWFYPSVGNTECNRYITWNYAENIWTWGELARAAMSPADAYQYPYMSGTDGHMYEHEVGWLANGASRIGECWAETGALSATQGNTTTDLSQLQIATGSGFDAVTLTVFGSYTPEGTEYEEGPYTPRDDGYTDARLSYRDMRFRFESGQDGPWAVGKVRADLKPGSGR